MAEPGWHAAIAYALTGVELELSEPPAPDPDLLVADLASLGWTSARIRRHAGERVDSGSPWPHQIPARLRQGCGAAQLYAALGRARTLLGLQVLEVRPPSSRTSLNADELRLLRDVPPHHGS